MDIKESLELYLVGQIAKHQINAYRLINAGASPDLIDTIEKELSKISDYTNKLVALKGLYEVEGVDKEWNTSNSYI
jgi:hypothetical protein|tara:strand:- start:290 stop:517 length:228 start_codon:yes stop_codon:yes gene_type:complete